MPLRSVRLGSRALLASALVGVVLLAAPGADAAKKKSKKADAAAPTITHAPPAQHDGTGPLLLVATIVDDSGVFDPALLVRAPGGAFERVAMQPVADQVDTYAAEVPAALLAGDLEYLIEAFDENGNGPARAGDEAAPLRIAFVVPPLVAPPPTPLDPAVAPSTEDEGGGALLWGAGIAVGGVILLGAAAGIGLAVYALTPSAPATIGVSITAGSPITAGAAP